MTRVNNRKGSLNKTPDVTCECGHRITNHKLIRYDLSGSDEFIRTDCAWCECKSFEPRDRTIPSQPVQFPGTAARVPFGPRQVARRNEDAS